MASHDSALKQWSSHKHGREVCRQWLASVCQKGDECPFLHRIDEERMPTCPHGVHCQQALSGCPYKHPAKQARCANQDFGFCSFGNRCQQAHVQCPGPPPLQNPQFFDISGYLDRPKGPQQKKGPCSYFSAHGWCPQFEMCNFKHESVPSVPPE